VQHDATCAAPDLDSDCEDDSDDVSDGHDCPMWDSSSDFFEDPIYSKRSSFVKAASPPGLNDTLPFGLHDQGHDDADSIDVAGFGLPRRQATSPEADLFDTDIMDTLDSNPTDSYQHHPKLTIIEVNLIELVRRLISISVCIGTPGPGFPPDEVGKIVEDLMACE